MSRCSVGAVRPASSPLFAPLLALVLAALLAGLAGACSDGGGPPPRCVTVDATCIPRYQPTFSNLYNNTLRDSCGSQSSVCHSAQGRRGGLSLESELTAYAELTDAATDRVVAGDPACSEVIVRLHGGGEDYLMPPGAQLPAADRCAMEQWIAAGAQRSNSNPIPISVPLASPAGQGAQP